MDISQLFPSHPYFHDAVMAVCDSSTDPVDRAGSFCQAHGYLACLQEVAGLTDAQYRSCYDQLVMLMEGPQW